MQDIKINDQTPHCSKHVLGDCASSEVYLMDNIELMKHYPDKYFDLACIDPPYGIGHSLLSGEKRGSKFVRTERHVDWDILPTDDFWIELFRVSKNQIIWGGNYFLDNFITYSNFFEIEGKTFAFRRKELFDITFVPKYMDLKNNNNCFGYWINRKWVSLSKIKDMIVNEKKVVDVSNLQWYVQIHLDYVFNLKTLN